jgi:hypothetical protein
MPKAHRPHTLSPAAAAWILAILAAPLLYVLSIGPVTSLQATHSVTISQGSRLDRFYGPLGTAMQRAPLNEPLVAYTEWWARLAESK